MRLAAFAAACILLGASLLALPPASSADEPVVLVVGDQDQMRTRNVLRVPLSPRYSEENWGIGILQPVHSTILITDSATGDLRPYVAKGVDADGNGVFDPDEYGVFRKESGTNVTDIVAYLDLNGLRWHDGVQVTAMDLLFSLHLEAMSPRYNPPLRALMHKAGYADSNFTWNRWLGVVLSPKSWAAESSLPGDPALRVAVRFRLQAPYAPFYEDTLAGLWLFPRHVWEGTGGGRHADFGRAIYPEGHPRAGQGIPVNDTTFKPFDILAAEVWEPTDADVIGSGPFRFVSWTFGVLTRLERNDAYFVGTDPADPSVVYDARLASYLRRPDVEAIVFKICKTKQLCTFSLTFGEIDYIRADIPPEFVPDLLSQGYGIRVWSSPDLGVTYLAYNMRWPWTGYNATPGGDAVDSGRPLRMAVAHLVDKAAFVRNRLQNYGFIADGPISPVNTLWNNNSLPRLPYDTEAARAILDAAHNASHAAGEHWWGDHDGDGWRELPGRGDEGLQILIPTPDYEPARARAGEMFAAGMRRVGLNVTAVPASFGTIAQALYTRNFDLLVSGIVVRTTDPDYLSVFFQCSGDWTGGDFFLYRPYIGYCDSDFDRVMELSRVEMDISARRHLIRWAQGIIMDDRPIEPLYYPTAIQATRADRFVNWTVGFGSLWNYGSWIGLVPVSLLRPLQIGLRYGTAMEEATQQRIEATVKTLAGALVTGAIVTFRILPEDGGRFLPTSGRNVTGLTDSRGVFGAMYEAPRVTEPFRDIAFEVVADHELAYAPVQRGFLVTVFPAAARFLSIQTSLPGGDLTIPGVPLPLRIEVLDQLALEASDAQVEARLSPANGTLIPEQGSAGEMSQLLFTPPEDLARDFAYRISIVARKPDYYSAYANVTIDVAILQERPVPPPTSPEGDLALRTGAALSLAAAAVAALWFVQRLVRRQRAA